MIYQDLPLRHAGTPSMNADRLALRILGDDLAQNRKDFFPNLRRHIKMYCRPLSKRGMSSREVVQLNGGNVHETEGLLGLDHLAHGRVTQRSFRLSMARDVTIRGYAAAR